MSDGGGSTTPNGRALRRVIGLTSVALGSTMVGCPNAVLAAAGIRASSRARYAVCGRGVTELMQGAGILARRQPTQLLRSRVIGDVIDLGALLLATRNARDVRRTAVAAVVVAGIAVVDVAATRRSASASDRPASEGGRGSLAAITINLPIDAVAGHTHELGALGDVELTPAPGQRGTEVRIDVTGRGGLREDLLGRGRSRQRTLVELRRFKQRLETGDVARSDGAPEGSSVKRQLLQRPGQPTS